MSYESYSCFSLVNTLNFLKNSKTYLVFFVILLISGCNRSGSSDSEKESIPSIDISYVNSYPHDTTSFTQGLLIHKGDLYESTGSPKNLPQTRSVFGTVDRNTGKIDVKVELDRNRYFGEGIVFLNGKVFQLTYKSGIGFVYDDHTFEKIKEFDIPSKEGWGLTTDGNFLIMSDGTDKLTFLDPISLKPVKVLSVTENNVAKNKLNELEFINGYIYSNVWLTNTIVIIDPDSGNVIEKLDLTPYANEAKSIYPGALEMNGIAYDSLTGSIFITGKLWPKIYEIKIPK